MAKSSGRDGCRGSDLARLAAVELVAFAFVIAHLSRRCLSDSISQRRSRWCERRPQPGDQHQDLLEHLPRHRDLSQSGT